MVFIVAGRPLGANHDNGIVRRVNAGRLMAGGLERCTKHPRTGRNSTPAAGRGCPADS